MRMKHKTKKSNIKKMFYALFLILVFIFPINTNAQSKLQVMQGIYGEIGHSRSNDGYIYRACSVQASVSPGKTVYLYVTLPNHANSIDASGINIFPTWGDLSGFWHDFPVGTHSIYRNSTGQWEISHEFLNEDSATRKYSFNVLYYLTEKDNNLNYSINTFSSFSPIGGGGGGSQIYYADCIVRNGNYYKTYYSNNLQDYLPKTGDHITVYCPYICPASIVSTGETSEKGLIRIIVEKTIISTYAAYTTLISGWSE